METLVIEVSESQKYIFIDLAKKLNTKYELLSPLTQSEEDMALFNAMKKGAKEGRMSQQEQNQFLTKIGL